MEPEGLCHDFPLSQSFLHCEVGSVSLELSLGKPDILLSNALRVCNGLLLSYHILGCCAHPVLDRPRSGDWDKYHCQSECFITKHSKTWDANLKKIFLSAWRKNLHRSCLPVIRILSSVDDSVQLLKKVRIKEISSGFSFWIVERPKQVKSTEAAAAHYSSRLGFLKRNLWPRTHFKRLPLHESPTGICNKFQNKMDGKSQQLHSISLVRKRT